MRVLGIILWVIVVWLATSFSWGVRKYTRTGFGVTMQTVNTAMLFTVQGVLIGVISDGDLRRLLQKSPDPLKLHAGQAMSRDPKTVGAQELATAALAKMEEMKITSLVVTNAEKVVIGVVHLHDLWRTELF